MIEHGANIRLFYPMLFASITILGLAITIIVGIIKVKGKDNNLFGNIFNRHVDEHIDTTDKLATAHTEVTQIVDGIPVKYQQELHSLEIMVKEDTTRLNKLVQDVSDINDKLDILLEWKFETERNKK